jgi:lipopolysaccharide export system protein LptA
MIRSALFLLLFLSASVFSEQAQKQVTLQLINADKNSNRMKNGSIESTLFGNVEFLWGETKIKTDSTIWKRGSGNVKLNGSVEIIRTGQNLTCRNAAFSTNAQIINLEGAVVAVDSAHEVTITADSADYFIGPDSLHIWEKPKMFIWSSTSTDSFTISSKKMKYTGFNSIAKAVDSVKIMGDDLTATCDSATYLRMIDKAVMLGNPSVKYATNKVTGEMIELFFESGEIIKMIVYGSPKAIMVDTTNSKSDTATLTADTLIFNISNQSLTSLDALKNGSLVQVEGDSSVTTLVGDSLFFTIDDSRLVKVVSQTKSSSEMYNLSAPEKKDQVWGDKVVIDFFEGGGGVATVENHARALLLSDGDSRNEIAGDTLVVNFDSDGASKIRMIGEVQGVILEQPKGAVIDTTTEQ